MTHIVIVASINKIIALNLQAFASLDLNGDGVISRREIEVADWNQLREYANEVITYRGVINQTSHIDLL